ncbi:citrate lyase holo-[acyl-carrier protein] synthase [Caproiciproducens sp. NJN-50]|uniref:citrate lyase holo-[acyl-carrier protein] synthase n=1 Tax=Caproiciproducens sp. NJN-50 TaxID=2507162 RepID=UPI000FFE1D25|nr:citrate lyase holo-[acyl-carrier protein] synthase [Caproiciproducens sp. NJN-50]QAT48762.1 citrate lyase holo-[acyl-carrier protein] synthase [Caproiciproducens sp. NJN-50]
MAVRREEEMPEESPATLKEILYARELRTNCQRRLLAEFGRPLVSFTLNIAGGRKAFPLAERTFREGKWLIARELERAGIPVAVYREDCGRTGYAGFYAVDAGAERVKRLAAAIEESGPLGRLFDIDVLRRDGTKISREDIGLPERTCLICGKPALLCSRSAAHPVEEVVRKTQEIMRSCFQEQYAGRVAQSAVRAMLYEVAVTPKPGLVDREGNGAHRDMDIFTFFDSISALAPCFRRFVQEGLDFRGEPRKLLASCRYSGLLAEDAMFRATGGVNTHKGLIFSLGVLCAAMGYLHGNGLPEDMDAVLEACSEIAAPARGELEKAPKGPPTHGEKAYSECGFSGARGEAAKGFPHVKSIALPLLRSLRKAGLSPNDAGVAVLLHLISRVDDTNAVSRSGLATYRAVQSEVQKCLSETSEPKELLNLARGLNEKFISLNISPGGCADLLAVTFFLSFLFPGPQ